jgi:hypothetical protein
VQLALDGRVRLHSIPSVTPLERGEHAVDVACIMACCSSGPLTVAQFSEPPKRMQTVHSTDVSDWVT